VVVVHVKRSEEPFCSGHGSVEIICRNIYTIRRTRIPWAYRTQGKHKRSTSKVRFVLLRSFCLFEEGKKKLYALEEKEKTEEG